MHLLLGPAIGAFLYSAGGFGLPFWLFGSFGIIIAFLGITVLSDEAEKTDVVEAAKENLDGRMESLKFKKVVTVRLSYIKVSIRK